jgi:hypothetical protein
MSVKVSSSGDGHLTVSVQGYTLLDPPTVVWSHIDGPMLAWASHLHWLTWWERVCLYFGGETIESLAQKRWPQRVKWAGRAIPNPELWYEIEDH